MSETLLKNHIECAPPNLKLLKEYSGKIHKAKRLRLIGRQGDSGFVRAPLTRSELGYLLVILLNSDVLNGSENFIVFGIERQKLMHILDLNYLIVVEQTRNVCTQVQSLSTYGKIIDLKLEFALFRDDRISIH